MGWTGKKAVDPAARARVVGIETKASAPPPGPGVPVPPVDPPELLSFEYSLGGVSALLNFPAWQPNGRVRFKCEETGGGDFIGAWTLEGTGAPSATVTGLTIGIEYTLYYQIDPIPDYPGWDEGLWRIIVAPTDPNLPTWTQPGKLSPIDGDWDAP